MSQSFSRLPTAAITYQPGQPQINPTSKAPSTPLQLMWWRFRQHRLAVVSLALLLLCYFVAMFSSFFAPHASEKNYPSYAMVPPQSIQWIDRSEGGWRFAPYVQGLKTEIDTTTRARITVIDPAVQHPLALFVPTEPYKVLGVFTAQTRLIGTQDREAPFFLLGSDRLGRDVLSRIIAGATISLTIGLVGVAISLILGVLLGGISGYFGGWIDNVIQRTIEFLQSLPTIPLWMGLAAAIPVGIPPLQLYFFITIILSVLGWTSLAREVRGKFMALRHEDFVTAAQLDGSPHLRTITRHIAPSVTSHVIATVTLAIPSMILAETSLSFLGIGLRAPVVSWGVLLQDAQNIQTLTNAPWLLYPGAAVVIVVLAFNFLGDGLRDAADPYAN